MRKQYTNLCMKLTRDSVKNPGKVASYLLFLYEEGEGVIYKEHLKCRGLIENETVEEFIKNLMELGYLTWDLEFNKLKRLRKYTTKPGFRLIKILKANNLKDLISLEELVINLIDKFDPPYTKEKEVQYRTPKY